MAYGMRIVIIASFNKIVTHLLCALRAQSHYDDVMKWKYFPLYWPFVREFTGHRWIPRAKSRWHGALMFSLICPWINSWVNNREAGDLRRHRAQYDVILMPSWFDYMIVLLIQRTTRHHFRISVSWINWRRYFRGYNHLFGRNMEH